MNNDRMETDKQVFLYRFFMCARGINSLVITIMTRGDFIGDYKCFVGTYYLHLQVSSHVIFMLVIDAAGFSEMLVATYITP
jgi:hypothetical protein